MKTYNLINMQYMHVYYIICTYTYYLKIRRSKLEYYTKALRNFNFTKLNDKKMHVHSQLLI